MSSNLCLYTHLSQSHMKALSDNIKGETLLVICTLATRECGEGILTLLELL